MKRIAAIRVRGKPNVRVKIGYTMQLLRLYNKNTCVVIPGSEVNLRMLQVAKDYITWGEIDEETFKLLLKERGRLAGNKRLSGEYIKNKLNMGFDELVKKFFDFKLELQDIPGLKRFFRLKPPTKGFDRKGIKRPFSMGGALGYRKENINELIKRMI